MSAFTLTQSIASPIYMLSKTDKEQNGQNQLAAAEQGREQSAEVTCGRCHQVSVDGARSVCSVCQGDVPQKTIKETIVFNYEYLEIQVLKQTMEMNTKY